MFSQNKIKNKTWRVGDSLSAKYSELLFYQEKHLSPSVCITQYTVAKYGFTNYVLRNMYFNK